MIATPASPESPTRLSAQSSTQSSNQPSDQSHPEQTASLRSHHLAIEQIASATGVDLQQVREIYEREMGALSSEARITQFVGVIVTRRVLLQLRHH